jgi:trigger factor
MAQATKAAGDVDTTESGAGEQEFTHDVKIEDAGPAKKKLTITIPAEEIDEKIDSSFATLTSQAVLPGFRPGRAPRKLIEKRFGGSVKAETRNQIVADAYSKAIEQHKIKVVGEPEADQLKDLEIEPGKALTFSVEIEVAPEFELPDLEGLKIKKPLVKVQDDDIDEELERQQFRFGKADDVKDEITHGDRVQGRAMITKADGELVQEMAEAIIAIPFKEAEGEGHFLGFYTEKMDDLFVGKNVGDLVTFETEVPANDERVALRGQKIKIEFTINRAVRVAPASVEEVAQTYGLENVETLRTEIKNALEQRAQQEQHAVMREQVAEQLLEKVNFELPKKLSAAQAARALDRARIELLYRGTPADEVEVRIAEMRADSDAEAQRRLKLFFILHALAEKYEIQVSNEEINGRIAQIAHQRGERPEKLRSQFAQQGRLQQIGLQIREHKALDRVLDKATVEEISADDWNELVESKTAAKPGAPKGKKKTTTKKKTSTKKSAKGGEKD